MSSAKHLMPLLIYRHRLPLDPHSPHIILLQWNKPRTVGSSNTRSPMLNRLIRDRKLAQIESHHLGLDLHLVELLPRVNPNNGANHLRHNNHVPQMGFDEVRLLVWLGFLFGLAEFLDQAHGFALEATVESAAGARVDYIAELFGGEVQESVRVVI